MRQRRLYIHILFSAVLTIPSLPVVDCCCTRSTNELSSASACCTSEPAPVAEPACPHCEAEANASRPTVDALTATTSHQCQCRHNELPAELARTRRAIRQRQDTVSIDSPQPHQNFFGTILQRQSLESVASRPPSAVRSKQQLLCRWLI